MGVHGVLDGQLVQPEHIGDRLHLVVVWPLQADPHEGSVACLLQFAHLRQCGGVSVLARQSLPVDVDAQSTMARATGTGIDVASGGANFDARNDGIRPASRRSAGLGRASGDARRSEAVQG